MAAKLLHSLTDDNPDLQKQIGCMTGIFQMFDRQQIITGRRISGHSPKRLSSGNSHFNNGTFETESNHMYHRPTAKENNSNKNVNERQRLSVESSRASFTSSSRSSSFSSLDCNRAAQPEPLSFDRIIFPETPSRDPAMSQSGSSPQVGRQSLDLWDVVKDSMYREARGLSVKTTTKEELEHLVMKHKDSPRPLPHSKSVDGMQDLPADLRESLRVLAKLREAPWYPNEAGERSRSSCESNDGFLFSAPKDAPRFSYDGRELNRLSFESRDTFKSTPKLKELPRLSLDSREGSMRSFNSDSKSNFSRNSHSDGGNTSRPPSVVAKLMGLETLPDQSLSGDNLIGLIKPVENSVPFLRSSKSGDPCQPVRVSNCSQNFWKEPASPHRKNPDSVMKRISSSRFPIEPAPWKQLEGTRGSPKPAFRSAKSPAREANSFPSVYSEIEKRLKDLEFNQSGKDLRALKQIMEAMQAKGLLEARGEEQDSNFTIQRDHEPRYTSPHLSARSVNQQKPHGDQRLSNSTYKGANSSRNFDSPIVIMKPAKLVEKHGIPASSVIPMDHLSGLPKLRGGEFANGRKSSVNSQRYREQVPKTSGRENSVSSTDNRKTSYRTLKATQTSTRSQQLPKENTQSSLKSSGSVSPRLQQKKLELEKRSRPPISPDSSKSRRQPNKQQPESSSLGGKRRPKSTNLQQNDDQSSEVSSETRNLSYQEDDISMQSDSNVVSDSGMDTEVTSSECYAETNAKYSVYGLVNKKSSPRLSEDGAFAEFGSVTPDHPSPVSVLDDTMYKDDSPSPVKQIPDALRDDGAMSSDDICSYSEDNLKSDSGDFGFSSEINRKKLENIENLVQKLRRLNSSHNEAHTDYIASLCENTNPDHRYVSEILLASGLLLRDLNSSFTTFQLHPSGHPINPELFLVLEQTKSSTRQKEEESGIEKFVHLMKPDREKFHRKLIFDAVNEILIGKLPTMGDSPEPWLKPDKLARKSLNAQKLLRELCLEIEKLQEKEPDCGLEEENDSLKGILWRDVMNRSENWTDFRGEISGMALDVERLIFKDLVSEIVNGESSSRLRTKPGRHCRRLFT